MLLEQLLLGKRILFFSQYFFGYEHKIKEKMEDMGAKVDMFDERSVSSSRDRALIKFFPGLFSKKTECYFSKIVEDNKDNIYDYVLFIDCEMASKEDIKRIRETFPSAKMCLHMWDSLSNLKGVEEKLFLFDFVSTFDKADADRLSIAFRPLFFCDDYISTTERNEYKYDLCFIGTIHSDRFRIIKKLGKQMPNGRFYSYPYLQSKKVFWLYKFLKKEFRWSLLEDFKYEKISASSIAEITRESIAVLDIQHPKQTGLTMRTLEMLGMKKKFITTNQDIKNYDFYNSNNIQLIDRNNPILNKEFFISEYIDIPEEVLNKYYIVNWIKEVLGIYG